MLFASVGALLVALQCLSLSQFLFVSVCVCFISIYTASQLAGPAGFN